MTVSEAEKLLTTLANYIVYDYCCIERKSRKKKLTFVRHHLTDKYLADNILAGIDPVYRYIARKIICAEVNIKDLGENNYKSSAVNYIKHINSPDEYRVDRFNKDLQLMFKADKFGFCLSDIHVLSKRLRKNK